jgi:D-proline reductase (dithiol) PrdB
VTGPALPWRRVAIVSSAGLVVRGENPFRGRDPDYRVIPAEIKPDELLISHISINFDRTGFQEDWNVVFPLDRLREAGRRGRDRLGGADPLLIHGRRCRWSRMPANWPAS